MSHPILRYFGTDHLPPDLAEVSRPFGALARQVAERGGDPAEVATALRKLLEANDAAVRAAPPTTETDTCPEGATNADDPRLCATCSRRTAAKTPDALSAGAVELARRLGARERGEEPNDGPVAPAQD